jgi:flagellar M-ring protein FliF
LAEESRAAFSIQTLSERWQQLSNQKKIAVVILLAAVFVSLFYLGQALARPRMVPLFSGLEPADAGRITARLQELTVPYQLADEGRTILVGQDQVYEMRIQLASAGALVGGSAGFEIFDQSQLGATDFNRRLDYLRALQEELRRTIVQLEEVEQARVHLALPEPSVFIQDTAEPTASIVLRLRPLSRLQPEQIRGIIYLVVGSVENLTAENVTVIDTQGNILSELTAELSSTGQLAEATLRQLEVRRSFEKEMEQRVQRVLERVLGAGQAVAMLTAELDFDSRESSIVTFAPEGVPRSRAVTREVFEGTGTIPGEAGTDSNIPGYPFAAGTGDSSYERDEETINYEISETTERQIQAPGRLIRLHAAVVVNDNGGVLTAEQLQQINELVVAAIGYQVARGDSISVQGMNFDTTQLDEAKQEMDEVLRREQRGQLINLGAAILLVLLLFFLVLRTRGARRERELEAQLATVPHMPFLEGTPAVGEQEREEELLHRRVRQLAEKEPDTAAYLIRAWLAEE